MFPGILVVIGAVCCFQASHGQTGEFPGLYGDRSDAPESRGVRPAEAFIVSALAPGASQRRFGAKRWIPYVALEAWGWLRYMDRRQKGRDLEKHYRDLAWQVARGGGADGVRRRDGDWHYYEALSRYRSSGAFDADPERAGVQPETDPGTYNGSIWELARAIHFTGGAEPSPEGTPEYEAALEYYKRRAVTSEFAWSWGGNIAEQEAYGGLIRSSDEAFRSATRALGVILANHLVSAVDALVTARLQATEDSDPIVDLESAIWLDHDRPAWTLAVHLYWPRR